MNSEKMSQNSMPMTTDRMGNQTMPNAGFLSLAGLMAAAGRNMGPVNPFMAGSQGPLSSASSGGHNDGTGNGSSNGGMGEMGASGGGGLMGNTVPPPTPGGGLGAEGSPPHTQGAHGASPMQQQPTPRLHFPGLLNSSEWNWSDFSCSPEGANALLERGRSRNWTYEETLELIGMYTSEEWQGKFGAEKKNHRAIWAALAAAITRRKDVSGDEARQRLNNLKALYNRIRRQLLAGEITSPQWEYWEPLHAFLGRPQPYLPLPPASPLPQFPPQPFPHFQGTSQSPHVMNRAAPEAASFSQFHGMPPHTSTTPHHNPHPLLGALGLAPPFGGFHGNGTTFHKADRNPNASEGRDVEGDERKFNAASSTGGCLAPGLDENSAGSGDVPTGCDEVSVPLSPEQFLSEDMERASPGTPSSQRPESYKLRHNNHLTLVLESLAGDESFMDVTLTAQGKAIKAHKSVLSAVSPYFRGVLKQNPCQHPIIIMPRDVKFDELSNIISYVYKGEMTVAAEDLSSLLKTAEVLQVTGLSPSEGSSGPGGIISQMQGLPTGVFSSTSTNTSSSSKNVAKKYSKPTPHHSQPATEESSQASAASEVQTKIDPNEFLTADMTCVKEEIQSENEETEDSTYDLPMDTVENEPNPPDSGELSSNSIQAMDSPSRSLGDPTGKPFNPGEPTSDDFPQDPLESPPSPSPYLCPHCLETHRPQDVLHSHLRLKHPSKPSFICPCGKVFVRQSIFAEHSKGCTF